MCKLRLKMNLDPVNDGLYDPDSQINEEEIDDNDDYEDVDDYDYFGYMITSDGDFIELSSARFGMSRLELSMKGKYACLYINKDISMEFDYRHVHEFNGTPIFVGSALIRVKVPKGESRENLFMRILKELAPVFVPVETADGSVTGFNVKGAKIVSEELENRLFGE